MTSTAKQPFLLWDKVYQKAIDPAEELWLLRAAEAGVKHFESQLLKSETLRSQFGLIFVHLSVEGHTPEIRKLVTETLVRLNSASPRLVNTVIRDALTTFLSKGVPPPVKGAEAEVVEWTKHSRVASILTSCVTFEESVPAEDREAFVVALLTIAHHPLACESTKLF